MPRPLLSCKLSNFAPGADSVNLYSNKCRFEGGCRSQASCGLPGSRRGVLCSIHKLPGVVRIAAIGLNPSFSSMLAESQLAPD